MTFGNYIEIAVLAALVMAAYIVVGSLPEWIDRFAAGGRDGHPTAGRKAVGVVLVVLLMGGFVLGHWHIMDDAETVPYVAVIAGVVGLLMAITILRRTKSQ